MTALADIIDKVKGFEVGGADYITKPFQEEEVLVRVENHITLFHLKQGLEKAVKKRTAKLYEEITERKQAEKNLRNALNEIENLKEQLKADNIYLREEIKTEHNFENIIGGSDELKYVMYKVQQIAATETTVLILGETGTGKELIARAIHDTGQRSKRPLIKVNCATLPSHLIESELFGHEKGSFTGAVKRQTGRFEIADGSTLFLDEIGELPLELQPKLLRVLQNGEFERSGNYKTIKTNVRVIAATNRNLEKEMQEGRFRKDLWYRLNVFPITLPPLRNRKKDIPELAHHFLEKLNRKLGKKIQSVSADLIQSLESYSWPGNVRELENIIERAVITTQGTSLKFSNPLEFRELSDKRAKDENSETLNDVEKKQIIKVLTLCNWQIGGKDGAAKILDFKPPTLRFRMKKLGITKPVAS
ncbi:sigma 54-interacting transcriptional regulator [Desulfococcaceae bacterium HSG9]|nr:sigma 54-interacting transcriptional regulator [Desulfococcaceae bacterium HSG9]